MIGQICYNILNQGGSQTIPSGINIFSNIIPQYANASNYITKLSITAQPGAKVIINETKEIIIGRTGVYEVEDVTITSLYFAPIKLYQYDATQSRQKIQDGQNAINTAVTAIKALTTGTAWLDNRNTLTRLNTLAQDIRDGYNTYMQGVNGVYTALDQNGDLNNVIIDFIYE